MGSEQIVGKIFGMFDKIDDIVYEPIKLVCDALRQPIKKLETSNDRKKAEYAQQLAMDLKKFETDLEMDKKRQEMELTDEEKRRSVELDNRIHEAFIQRQEQMMQLEMKYRTELSDLNAKMTKVMADMQADAIRSLFTLIEEKKMSYLDVQTAYRKELMETFRELEDLGIDKETSNPIFLDGYNRIKEESSAFHKMLAECVERAGQLINEDGRRASERMNEYFKTRENKPSLLPKNIDAIEYNNN